MIIIKTREELELMYQSAQLVSKTLGEIAKMIKPGVTTQQINDLGDTFIRDHGAYPAFLGMYDFPKSLCISPNEQVVHGIPNDEPLQEGDIVSVDVGVYMNGFYGDHAYSFKIGEVSPEVDKLLKITKESLYEGIRAFKKGNRVGDISYAIQQYNEKEGYGVVRELCGHGLGRDMHEDPQVPTIDRQLKEARTCFIMLYEYDDEGEVVDSQAFFYSQFDGMTCRESFHYILLAITSIF